MTSLKKMALPRFQNGKSRFFFTIIGVALSTAMLLAVFLGSDAAMDVMRRYTICQQGEWYWSMLQLPGSQAKFLLDSASDDEIVSVYGGKYQATDNNGISMTLYGVDDSFLEMMQANLIEGSWPTNPEEIAVEQGSSDWNIGDTVQISDSHGELREITVVGFYGNSALDFQFPSVDGSVTAFYSIDWANTHGEDVYRFFSMPKTYTSTYSNSIAQISKTVLESAPQAYVLYNNALITFSGYPSPAGQNIIPLVVLFLRIILVMIIAVASILLISNSFSISMAQKKKELALLVSIGSTMRQVGNCLLFEALSIGLVGIPLGVILGYGSLFVAFRLLSPLTANAGAMLGGDLSFHLNFNIAWIFITVTLSSIVLFTSAKRPMKLFKKESVINNLFGNSEVMVGRRITHQGRIVSRFLGAEAGLAVKEAKRNWRGYKSAVRSLAVCIVIFIGSAGLSIYLPNAYFSQRDIPTGPITVSYASTKENVTQTSEFQKLTAPQTPVKAISITETESFDIQNIPASAYTEQNLYYMDMLNAVKDGDQYSTMIQFTVIPDEEFEKLANSSSAPEEQIGCILQNRFFYSNEDIIQTKLHAGDSLNTSLAGLPVSLYIVDVDDKRFVEDRIGDLSSLSVLIKRTDAEHMFEQYYQQTGEVFARSVTISYQTDSLAELQSELLPYSYNDLFTAGTSDYLIVSDNSVELMLIGIVRMLLYLICYGFSAMLALISICQMITTISTELTLQQKDFALLQSVGVGEQSLKKMIYFQAFVYVANAIKWAIPLGLVLLFGEYYFLRNIAAFLFSVPWWAFATVIIVAAIVIGLVAIPPIRSLKKQSIIENIRVNE